MGMALYILLPAAPPWWVSLYGLTQPTADLVAQTNISAGMDRALVQSMIKGASQWFAAIPSLHGAYPVLLLLLALGEKNRMVLLIIAIYGAAMWTATVVLNQHYIIDLLAGMLLAFIAWVMAEIWRRRNHATCCAGYPTN